MVTPALRRAPEVVRLEPGTVTVRLVVDPAEPCFAGHYPDFPILPGVMLVDTVQRAVERFAAAAGHEIRLTEIRSMRFAGPVFPGDTVDVDCAVVVAGRTLTAKATCRTARGRAAGITLRYALSAQG